MQINLNEPAGVLVKTTCVDFPSRVACSFFFKGCNLRCPYCYNTDLVLNTSSSQDFSSINQVIEHLEKRRNILSGFVLSGGEALLSPQVPFLIQEAKKLNYKIKIDTNGTLPQQLESILKNSELKPDFVALDFKTSFEKYYLLAGSAQNSKEYIDEITSNLKKKILTTISLLEEYLKGNYEIRTVLVPNLVDKIDIEKMAYFIPKNASWKFAQFNNSNCLNPLYNKILPYSDLQLQQLVQTAKKIIPNADLR